jgi:hypothetical protein
MYRRRDDKTEVKSLALPETTKIAMALANLANVSKRELFALWLDWTGNGIFMQSPRPCPS